MLRRASDALETWLYELNERDHWLFRLLEWGNDQYARIAFRGVRKRAARIDDEIPGRDRSARLRFATPADADALLELFGRFDFSYVPPHPLTRPALERVLRRPSYLPFVILCEGDAVGYALVRLLFPKRAFTGVWTLTRPETAGFSRAAVRRTGQFTDAERIVDFVTVPLDNLASKKGAEWAGWSVIRQNRRFFLLQRPVPPRRWPFGG
jgi:hypothetical protein